MHFHVFPAVCVSSAAGALKIGGEGLFGGAHPPGGRKILFVQPESTGFGELIIREKTLIAVRGNLAKLDRGILESEFSGFQIVDFFLSGLIGDVGGPEGLNLGFEVFAQIKEAAEGFDGFKPFCMVIGRGGGFREGGGFRMFGGVRGFVGERRDQFIKEV